MRLLVCGSRSSWDAAEAWKAMDEVQPVPELVICGGASGVDNWAQVWAVRRGIPCMVFPAAWPHHGRSAGPIRNGWMLKYGQPDLVLALPGGAGTASMIDAASKAGVPVKKAGKWTDEVA